MDSRSRSGSRDREGQRAIGVSSEFFWLQMCLEFKTLYLCRLEIWLHDNPGFQSANLQYQAVNEDIFTRPSQLIRVGDILSYDDGEENGVQSVRIKDYGSSAVRGEYYVVTPILDPDSLDDSCDEIGRAHV